MSSIQQVDETPDRREFFRIDDTIRVSYRQLGADALAKRIEALEQGTEGSFTIMTRMQAISQHLSASLHRIEQRDPDIADYLKALDEKIDLLGQNFLANESDLVGQPTKAVNLSAGGIALDSAESLEVGTLLEIKLLLLPSYTGILAFGELVGVMPSTENEGYPHRLRINFVHIRENDRDALIRHILRRQGEMLRLERERNELLGE
ncbi:MAG: PilZ domain-containing protein [Gammaproteobacteria bacterium]|nr:PilZ domain-containing protein [Gammaproteobacteria bacterium]